MPKMRGFKPELWTDEKFVDLEPLARLLFMGMWTYACDNGHLDDKPKQIKMRVLPTDDVDAISLIDQMVELGMVMRKEDGLTIPKLREHQRIDDRYFTWCDRCDPSEIPEKARERHAAAQRANAVHTSGSRRAPMLKEGSEGRKVKEGESESSAAGKPPTPKSTKKPAKRLDAEWLPTDDHLRRCLDLGVEPALELEKFRAHAEANDRRQVNWNAAFTQWLLNARPAPSNVRHLPSGEGPNDWMRRRPTP